MTPDQLSVEIDTHPNFISTNYECCLSNPKSTLEVIQKLRDQTRKLQRFLKTYEKGHQPFPMATSYAARLFSALLGKSYKIPQMP
ncbi:hypothetical protein JTE90_010378 [Oedothorax gibbosus]|uniref:Uncharacterized protein n=1 Tax=Oedothorax gibbosus TaxID=931172 RepID=A0AAV6W3D4_9ARAC|nr:hypothetical protein JTE90_010378 [Oedothorax gibbosus]